MEKISLKHQKIISYFLQKGSMSSSALHSELLKNGEEMALVTVKRTLSFLSKEKILKTVGTGRSTTYDVTVKGRIFAEVNAEEYFSVEPDKRYGLSKFNFELLRDFPTDIFTNEETQTLENATVVYKKRTADLPLSIQKKELERMIIELSWKSSKIEGNTYSLLETEELIMKNKESPGHDKKETMMILNHKDAFTFIHENSSIFKTLNRANLEKLHAILVKDLSVNTGFRKKPVGVTGSKYLPLDNIHQIEEATEKLSLVISQIPSLYAKSLISLLGLSYIQPFEDGNKRTSRLFANAMLLAHNLSPLSYRSVDENEYKKATLLFYELNSIMFFKKIFIEQYEFAAKNYAVQS